MTENLKFCEAQLHLKGRQLKNKAKMVIKGKI